MRLNLRCCTLVVYIGTEYADENLAEGPSSADYG
jgi:hypothetical protein